MQIKTRLHLLFAIILLAYNATAQNSLTKIVHRVKPSVFKIITYDRFNTPSKQGTGFFIDSSGTALSNAHVFEDAYKAEVITATGDTLPVELIIAQDREIDIIKFKVKQAVKSFPALEFNQDTLLEGDDIFVIGSPQGLEGTISSGIIASMRDLEGYGDVIQITAPISHGSSGSPVINMKGKVLGIATMIFTHGQNLNFAIDVHKIEKVKEDTVYLNMPRKEKLDPKRIVYLTNGAIITKSFFLKECLMLNKDKDFHYGGVNEFCECYYENLLTNYSDEEISALVRYSALSDFIYNSVSSNEKYYAQLKKCTSNLILTKELETYFMKLCTNSADNSRKAQTLDTRPFCSCTLDRVKKELTMEQFVIFINALQYYRSRGIDNFKYLSEDNAKVKEILENCLSKHRKK